MTSLNRITPHTTKQYGLSSSRILRSVNC